MAMAIRAARSPSSTAPTAARSIAHAGRSSAARLRAIMHVRAICVGRRGIGITTASPPGNGRSDATRSITRAIARSEEHTSELQLLMRLSYAVFFLKKKQTKERAKKTALNNKQKNHSTYNTTSDNATKK